MRRKKPKAITTVKPNRGLEQAYKRKMQSLIGEMKKDVEKELLFLYEEKEKTLAMDARPPKYQSIAQRIAALREVWYQRYDRQSNEMARWFAESTERRTSQAIRKKLKEAGLTVEIKMTPKIKLAMREAILENAKLIKSIPRKYLARVQAAATKSFEKGRDLKTFTDELFAIGDLTEKRAALIARDQTDKNTQKFALEEAKSVGATQGKWLHVPGVYSSRITHKQMDKKIFDLATGLWDEAEGKFVKPGELPFCACQFAVIIPGFE